MLWTSLMSGTGQLPYTSCPLSFSLKILLNGPKRSVFLGCSYLAEENLNTTYLCLLSDATPT